MSITKSEITFPSSDGVHTIYGCIYRPSVAPKGIVQIAHGMIEHFGRYDELARYFAEAGYVVGGNDHLGHGKTAGSPDNFGFFAKKGGVDYVLSDLHTMNGLLKEEYKDLPLVLLGHSMGSFIVRLYTQKYPTDMQGLIIHGTGGPNPLLPVGQTLAATVELFCGSHHRSKLIAGLAFAGYNSHYDKSEGIHAWLTRDKATVENYEADPFTQYIFTVSGMRDLFRMVKGCNAQKWFESFPKALPTLVISGDDDPVGNYGKGPGYVYKQLLVSGVKDVTLKMYEGARHELFNETNKEEVKADLLSWIESVTK